MNKKMIKRYKQRKPSCFSRLHSCLSTLALVVLFLGLSACDGGILGTGDGDSTIIPPETMNPGTDSVIEPPNPADYDINDLDVPAPDLTDIAFGNNEITQAGGQALVRVVHAITDESDNLVVVDRQATDNPFLNLPGISFIDGSSEYRALDFSRAHDFDVYRAEEFRADANNAEQIAGVNPFYLSSNTVSTMIVRGSSTAGKPIDIVALKNRALSGTGLSFLRVVHAAPAFADKGAIDVHLLKDGADLEPQLPAFDDPLTYDKPNTDYLEVEPGNYTFTGLTVGGGSTLIPETYAVELNPGQVLTFVLRDNVTGVIGEDIEILVLQDSTLP